MRRRLGQGRRTRICRSGEASLGALSVVVNVLPGQNGVCPDHFQAVIDVQPAGEAPAVCPATASLVIAFAGDAHFTALDLLLALHAGRFPGACGFFDNPVLWLTLVGMHNSPGCHPTRGVLDSAPLHLSHFLRW